jgi:hypothetical protein
MARIVVGSPNLTQLLLLYPGLGPTMLEQYRRSSLLFISSEEITGTATIDMLIGQLHVMPCQLEG